MTEHNNFQRIGSDHNAGVGSLFEGKVRELFLEKGIVLRRGFPVAVGVADRKKLHKFDLGSDNPRILIECKSHTWTQGGNMPSAKMTVWNEAMYYFHVAPAEFRKILLVLKHERAGQSLAARRLFPPPKQGGWPNGSNGITLQSTAVGSI